MATNSFCIPILNDEIILKPQNNSYQSSSPSSSMVSFSVPDSSRPAPASNHKAASPIQLLQKNTRGKEDIIAGSIAAAVSRFMVAPFDVLKIRFQLDLGQGAAREYGSIWSSTKAIYAREGIRGFWKGNLAATLMVAPYGAGAFYTQQKLKSIFLHNNRDPSPLFSVFSGSAAGVVGTLASYPLDLLRTRLASLETSKYASQSGGKIPGVHRQMKFFEALRSSLQGHGIRGLYDGLTPALIGIVPYMGLQFGFYDLAKRLCASITYGQQTEKELKTTNRQNLLQQKVKNMIAGRSWEPLVCGSVAGLASKFLTMPFDVLKKRYQVANFSTYSVVKQLNTPAVGSHKPLQSSLSLLLPSFTQADSLPTGHVRIPMIQVAKGILEREGIKGFYKGLTPALLKAAPASGITFAVYELCIMILVDK